MNSSTITPPDELIAKVHDDLLTRPGPVDAERVWAIARSEGIFVDRAHLLSLTEQVRNHVDGLGPLQEHVRDGITDVLLNADGHVWVDSAEGLTKTGTLIPEEKSRALATRLAALGHRRLDDAMPWADAQLPGGLRLHAVLPPLSSGGALISIRRAATTPLTFNDLQAAGTLSDTSRTIVESVVRSRLAFLVSGGTGTGKTTLMGAMLTAVDPSERIVIVEDATELAPEHPHVVHLQARHPNAEGNGEITLGTLVRQCLRMRPDRIIVGECRGEEVRELLQALNTGHEGGGGTIHANTAGDIPARLEALGALAGLDRTALAAQVLAAIDVVLHMERKNGLRRLATIAVLTRGGNGQLVSEPAVTFPASGSRKARYFPAWDQLRARIEAAS